MKIQFIQADGSMGTSDFNLGFSVVDGPFSIYVKRSEQAPAHISNLVSVSLEVSLISTPLFFDYFLFNNHFSNVRHWSLDVNQILEFYVFNAKTWRLAFESARVYTFSQLTKYAQLVADREMALINAEF